MIKESGGKSNSNHHDCNEQKSISAGIYNLEVNGLQQKKPTSSCLAHKTARLFTIGSFSIFFFFLKQQRTLPEEESVCTFAAPIMLGKVYDEQPSGLCPRLLKGV